MLRECICSGGPRERCIVISKGWSEVGLSLSFPWRWSARLVATALLLSMFGCARVSTLPPGVAPEVGWTAEGIASWYGQPFHGRITASGERYDMEAMTAAHRTLPFGTVLRVQNLESGRHATLRINDRGPFVRNRVLDVSRRGARELGMLESGIARVRMTVVQTPGEMACWEVQVGAFRDFGNADGVVARLEADGHRVRIESSPGNLHLVRVGPLDSRREAERVAQSREGVILGCPDPG